MAPRESVSVSCHGKLNLFLEVLGKRPDGYHEIETVMIAAGGVADLLEVRVRPGGGVELSVQADPAWKIPDGEGNLVHRAARAYLAEAGKGDGASIALTKRIPPGAGMGGGSSDAAATLVALDRLLGRVPVPRLYDLAAALGSDVPFFLCGGAALARGRGEELAPLHWGWESAPRFVVYYPGVAASTTAVYARCRPAPEAERRDPEALIKALLWGDPEVLAGSCFNRLTEPAREVCPEIADAERRLAALGLGPVHMTGSGSACFVFLGKAAPAEVDLAALTRGAKPGAWAAVLTAGAANS